MSSEMTYFSATVDFNTWFLRPRLLYELPWQNYSYWYSMVVTGDELRAIDQTDRIYENSYTTRLLRPSVTGEYTITIDSADGMWIQTYDGQLHDSQLWLYDTTFDPADPLPNLMAMNEQIDHEGNSYYGVPPNWLSYLPDMHLVAGHTYELVISVSDLGSAGTAYVSIDGPGAVQVTVPGAPDNTPPIVGSVGLPAAGTYGIGGQLEFTIGLDEVVTVDTAGGTPTLSVAIGGQTVQAQYAGGSGTATLTFRATLASGHNDTDGIGVTALALNGGRIHDAAGNDADLALRGMGSTSAVLVDTVAPTVQSITVAHATRASLSYTVTFSESVSGVHAGDFTVTAIGPVSGQVAAVAPVNGKTWTVTVDALAGAGSLRLDLKGTGTGIQDTAGNAIAAGFAGGQSQQVDLVVPAVTAVGAPAAGTYRVGEYVEFTVTLDDTVIVDTANGVPRLALTIGGQAAGAEYYSGSGTNVLVFRHVVAPGDNGPVSVGALSAGGGTLKDAAGNDAALALGGHAPVLAGVLVDGSAPDTNGPAIVSAVANGRTLVLTCVDGGPLDAAHVAPAGAFTVKVDGVDVGVTAVAVDGAARTVTLTLGTAVRHQQAVTVAYADPTNGNDVYAIQDGAGNDAAALPAMAVTNVTPPVVLPAPGGATTIDGMLVRIDNVTGPGGTAAQVVTIPVVTAGRVEQVGDVDVADIPLVWDDDGGGLLTAQVPLGFGLRASGAATPAPARAALADLVREIRAHTADGSADQVYLTGAGNGFVGTLDGTAPLLVRTIVPTAAPDAAPGELGIVGRPPAAGHIPTAVVIDASALPSGSSIALDDVEFAVVVGAVHVVGGAGAQIVWGDGAAQRITLGAGDDELHGGAGDDIMGSAAGNDRIFGDEGNDIVYGGRGNDTIDGGSGDDIVQLFGAGRSDYTLRVVDGQLVMTHRDGGTDGIDVVGNVETLRFAAADMSVAGTVTRLVEAFTGAQASVTTQDAMSAAVAAGASLSQVAHALYGQGGPAAELDDAGFVTLLYRHVLDRVPDAGGLAYWLDLLAGGVARADVALGFADSAEKLAMPTDLAFNATDVATLVRLYSTLFARAPDEGGLNYWIAAHEQGMSLATIADGFVASQESVIRYAGQDDASFVAALYRTALDREGSAGEVQYWTDQLAGGALDRGDVVLGFAESAEKVALVGTLSTTLDTLHG